MSAKTSRDTVDRKNITHELVLHNGIIVKNLKTISNHTEDTLKLVSRHITDMGAAMATAGPEKRIVFTKVNEDAFVKSVGINPHDIDTAIKHCKIISSKFKTLSNPFYILMSAMISYHYKKKTMVGKVEYAKVLTLYLSLRIYKAAFGAFFPSYLPNPDVMAATIERLGSNRFNVKKYKTMFNTIVYISESHYENFQDILENPIDDNIIYYISNLYSRIKLMMRLISNKYYENHKKGIRQSTDTVQSEGDDGDTYLNDVENISTMVAINSRKIFMSFVSDTVASPKILKQVCSITNVSFSKMTITFNLILSKREQMVETLLVKMLSHYYMNGGKVIKSAKFVNSMVDIYKVSNSADETILEIKTILHELMTKYSKDYLKTSHAGQLSNLKKTIFLYIALYAVDVM